MPTISVLAQTKFWREWPLSADPGSYALTGLAASVLSGRMVTASPGAYSLIGADAGLFRGFFLSVDSGTYALTGATADLLA